MLDLSSLKQAIHFNGLSITEQILLCLAVDKGYPKTIAQIRELATKSGAPGANQWNIGAFLSAARPRTIRTDLGWELGAEGISRVLEICAVLPAPPSAAIVSELRKLLPKISNPDTRAFVQEAISCYESKLYRAAIVLSWVGALSTLYEYVLTTRLAEFNAAALQRDPKWKSAKTADDLARMKEHDFLQVIEKLSIIGKSVKEQLEGCLKLRNGCGHPNSLKIGASSVQSHIETLVLNIFTVFV